MPSGILRTAAGLALLATLLAGCGTPAPLPASPPDPSVPAHLQLTGCHGWDAASALLPQGAVSPSIPAGWEEEPAFNVVMFGMECERLSLGPFERGPVRLLYDAQTRTDERTPAACQAFRAVQGVLNSLWVDDAEVAAYLQEELEVPVLSAAVAVQDQPAGPGTLHTWSWGSGASQSTITVPDDGTGYPWTHGTQLFWPRGEGGQGLGVLTISYEDRLKASVTNRAAFGTMQPPMLLGSLPGGVFAGDAAWSPSFSAEGVVALYADTACAHLEG